MRGSDDVMRAARIGTASLLAFLLASLLALPALAHAGEDHADPLAVILHQDTWIIAIGILAVGTVALSAWWRGRGTGSGRERTNQ